MVEVTAITGMLTSLKAAKDIAEAMIGLRDAAAFQAKAIEFQSKILDAQGSAFAANDERATLIEKISSLEKEVARLKTWEAEKQRYELMDLYRGLFAYVPKQGEDRGEPPHALCAQCYQRGVKSLLQTNGDANVHQRAWVCPNCKTSVKNQWIDMGSLIRKSREPRV